MNEVELGTKKQKYPIAGGDGHNHALVVEELLQELLEELRKKT